MTKPFASEFIPTTFDRSLGKWSVLLICSNFMFMAIEPSQSGAAEAPQTKLPEKSEQISPVLLEQGAANQGKKQKSRCMPRKPCPDKAATTP